MTNPSNLPPNFDYLDTGVDDRDDDKPLKFKSGDVVIDVLNNLEYTVWQTKVDGDGQFYELINNRSQKHMFREINDMRDFELK